ncbi:MAG: putative lipoprotein [uncultured Nocardioidaceae bacterium]|uniref:Putative lipoprotein n=1 Tax=uncultured Nocardioidaceae bacterium TaxID=253824 RepID=A0A6J4M4A5_9ACTN|nr:MAG: putative lipoprotein [uncultured Nocardioidaceae bacterium]
MLVLHPVRRPGLGSRRRLTAAFAAAAVTLPVLAACSADAGDTAGEAPRSAATESETPAAEETPAPPVRLVVNAGPRKPVPVDTLLEVSARNGSLERVSVQSANGALRLPGELKGNRTWRASERLEPGRTYRIAATSVDEDGKTKRLQRTFKSVPLTLDQQTYASIAPIEGETVGVGMPVVVAFDVPVTDRASIEEHLSVQSSPRQPGTWHWISDHEVHWRPKTYWRPGTDVTVDADINGVDAGAGIYGQEDRTTRFTVGDAVVMDVDVAAHTMKVSSNGRVLRTIPISAGKPGFTTRSGVKVIIEKFRTKTMDAATTGIEPGDPEYYNIENVEYAQRVTYSGEFLHAAPWSVGSQGAANVSHGCVGMSTEAAAWLYGITKRGDIVDVTGSDRAMEATNGWGDWNVPWRQYQQGSALS